MTITTRRIGRLIHAWGRQSNNHALRNAMVSCTELAARAHQRREVEAFVANHLARWSARQEHRPVQASEKAALSLVAG